MSGQITVIEHPTGALCLIRESTDDSGQYECSETYLLPDGVLAEDVVTPPEHPNTVQRFEPLPEGMTAATLTALVNAEAEKLSDGTDV